MGGDNRCCRTPHLGVSGLLLPFRFARCAASRSARSGKKASPVNLGPTIGDFPPRVRGPDSLEDFVAWPLLPEGANWEVRWDCLFTAAVTISPVVFPLPQPLPTVKRPFSIMSYNDKPRE